MWIENPGYPAAARVLPAAGALIVPVPVDGEGLVVEAGIRLSSAARLAYVTPARQAPLGFALSLERRMRLLQWAAAVIFEDDYDGEYRYRGRPRAALMNLDKRGCVVYAGTFSKLMYPALKLAYVVPPEPLVDPFASALSLTARHLPVLTQAVLADFLVEGHFGRHIRRMRELYGERAQALEAAAQRDWTGLLQLPSIDAGLDTAARLAFRGDDLEIAEQAARATSRRARSRIG